MTYRNDNSTLIESLFEQASRRPPGEREAFLASACGDDVAVRTEVESLLRAEEKAGDFMRRQGWHVGTDVAVTGPKVGRILGAYKLQAKIGEGGMSTVYLAVRADDQFRKRVAIKLVPLAMASSEHRRRFRTERHILASLDHPLIARLYDAGTSDEGLPYVVMEYVEGEPIDEYCDRHRLSIVERLELFRMVCAAVHFAHQNLVVHRDLKPSNILVTGEGVPKLLDFGIAKLLNPELMSPSTQPTLTVHRMMTPDYASLEQVQGKAITTASDVYSLGVLLYKLLSGHLPHHLGNKTPQEIERILTDEEPIRPSVAVGRVADARDTASPTPKSVSRVRRARTAELRRLLAGDLDNVIMMALRPEPQRRYGSVERLAEDIGHHLRGLPVLARGDALGYRFRKFVGRHRFAVAATVLLAAALTGFAAVMVAQSARVAKERDQARLERDKSERALDFVEDIFKVADPGELRGQDLSARQIVEQAAARVSEKLETQPEVRAQITNSLGNIHRNLGLYQRAHELLTKALEVRESTLGPEHPDVAESLNDLSLLLMDQGKFDEAAPLLERALAIREQHHGVADVAETINNIGLVHHNRGDYATAETYLRKGLELNRKVFGNHHARVALSLNNLATTFAQKGDYAAGEAAFRETLEIQRKVYGRVHPEIARTLSNLGQILRARGDLDAAEQVLREALDMQRDLVGNEHMDVATTLTNLGIVLEGQGDYGSAETLLRDAHALWLKLFGRDHLRTGASLYYMARSLAGAGKYIEAEQHYREALEVFEVTLPDAHHYLAHPLVGLGQLFLDTGQPRDALPLLRRAVEQERLTLPEGHIDVAEAEGLLGECLMRLGDFDAAERLLLRSYPVARDMRGAGHRQTLRVLQRIVELYSIRDRPVEAARYRAILAGQAQ